MEFSHQSVDVDTHLIRGYAHNRELDRLRVDHRLVVIEGVGSHSPVAARQEGRSPVIEVYIVGDELAGLFIESFCRYPTSENKGRSFNGFQAGKYREKL